MARKAAQSRTAKRSRVEAGNRIEKLADAIVAQVRKHNDPFVDIPSRTLSNVRFNEKKGIIEMLDGTQKRSFFSLLGRRGGEGSQAKKFMQTVKIAEKCKMLIDEDITTSLREVFYSLKVPVHESKELIFYEQEESDPIIEDVEVSVASLREELGIHAEPKGAMVGPMTIVDSGDTIDLTAMGSGGWQVPSVVEPEVIQFKKHSAAFILLVEKGTQWNRFNQDRFWEKHNCMLIHGGGQPPRGVRRLMHRMHKELKLPVYVLVDNDPWGYYIYSVVKQGSINLAFESQRMAIPAARFIGMSSYDADKFNIPKQIPMPLKDEDTRRAKEILEYPWFQSKEWQREIKHMLSLGVKLELEVFASKGDFRYITREYAPRKLKEQDWLD
ncbi:MAG: DNA topoisomerase IV subunit A [Planctomycetes bacterium]|nr:DNA topoisomerase IV subunit A [Planctomycetota bacterium]